MPAVLLVFAVLAAGSWGISNSPVRAQEPPPFRLTEFSSNPAEAGNDGVYEWVELQNVTGDAVSTQGWSIGDLKSDDPIPAIDVPAGGYLLITGEKTAHPDGAMAVRIEDGTIGSGLNNGGDVVRLIDPTGTVVESVVFGTERVAETDGPAAPPEGRSAAFDHAQGRWRTALVPSPGMANTFTSASAQPPGQTGSPAPRADVRFDAESGMSTPAWILLGAAGAAGIAGVFEVAYRQRRRWQRAA